MRNMPRVNAPITNEIRMETLIWINPIKSLDVPLVFFVPFPGTVRLKPYQGKCVLAPAGGARELRLFTGWEAQFVTGALYNSALFQ